jgi:hypothetical protein
MIMRKFKFIGMILALFMVVSLVGGCASTPKQKQLQVMKAHNRIVADYIALYKQQDPATKMEWKERITPLVQSFDDAMTIYDTAILSGDDPAAEWKAYEDLSFKLFTLFGMYGIEIKEK